MGINVHGVTWFIERVLPACAGCVPDAELWLVGRHRRARSAMPRPACDGSVSSMRSGRRYRRAAVVINPQQFGTGLSIKSVDALLHGRPLVTTASGRARAGGRCRLGLPAGRIGRGVLRDSWSSCCGIPRRRPRSPSEPRSSPATTTSETCRRWRTRSSPAPVRERAVTRRVVHYVDSEIFGGQRGGGAAPHGLAGSRPLGAGAAASS